MSRPLAPRTGSGSPSGLGGGSDPTVCRRGLVGVAIIVIYSKESGSMCEAGRADERGGGTDASW